MECNSPDLETTQISKNSRIDEHVICTMEYYAAKKMNEWQLHARMWMNPTKIMLSKKQKT